MNKDYLLKISKNLYRLTLLFPKKEPLRYKLRKLADEILSKSVLIIGGTFHQSKNLPLETEEDLEVMDSYLELAKSQNWVSPYDVLEIQKEYVKIKKEISRLSALKSLEEKTEERQQTVNLLKEATSFDNRKKKRTRREEKILAILKERGKIQVGELKEAFPQISKRTLRRDFKSLIQQGLVKRVGERNNTFYQIKG